MSHTPGPWFVMEPGSYALDDLVNLFTRNWGIYADSFGDKVHHIARGAEELNAHLIASAPNMLALLIKAERAIHLLDQTQADNYELSHEIKAVIAMAKGEK